VSLTALALLLTAPAAANGNQSLGQSYNQLVRGGGVVSQGVGLRDAIRVPTTNNITISGIPSGATVSQAWLYVVEIVNSTSTYDTSFTFNGNTVTGSLIGTGSDTCWSRAGNVTIRTDVTSLVTGNGSYSLAGVGLTGVEGQGASLVVVYTDPTASSSSQVVINDGALSGNFSGQVMSTTLSGFTIPTGVTSASFHIGMGDSQSFGNGAVTVDGVTVLAANSFTGHDGGGWDDYSVTPSLSALVPGDTSLNVSFQITGDCLIWPYVAMAWNSCAATTWYLDGDGDGYGGSTSTSACTAPSGYIATGGDCDDSRASVNPGALEYCNSLDDDCDGTVDESSAVDAVDWYPDVDGDTYGDALYPSRACTPPTGHIADGADCFDGDPLTYPGAPEGADGVDNDCDGVTDEGTSWFDDDGDGFTEAGGDCDDADAAIAPAELELPDSIDNDCDGVVDEGTELYDDDGDGLTEAGGDCNDADLAIYPGAAEVFGDGVDNDCDGVVDGGEADADGDGTAAWAGDCDDTDAGVGPGAPERADGVDNDCDGLVDEGTELYDDDGDGISEADGDCDDGAAGTAPGATENPTNGVDDDCDGDVDEGGDSFDDDGDGVSEAAGDCDDADPDVGPTSAEGAGNGVDDDCDGEVDEASGADADGDGFSAADGDCDDADGWASPGAAELCDGVDNNCDGVADEGCDDAALGGDAIDPAKTGCATAGAGAPGALGLLGLMGALLGRLRRRRAR